MMLTLTILRNPFNTAGREILTNDFVHDKTISQYFQPYTMGSDEFIYSSNGHMQEANYVPMEGAYIAVCPVVGKNVLASILSIGLMMYTSGIASGGGMGSLMNPFWRGVTSMAIGMIGGALISHLFPTPTPESSNTTTAYGFGNLSPQVNQGCALPKTYGTMMTAGVELAKHVTTDGDKQYLNLLLTGGQGPIDSITDIRINGNPIANYAGVTVDTRLGTNDQIPIPNFNDTYADQALSYELTVASGWATQQIIGNAGQGIEITIELPNGLYHTNDDASLGNANVTIISNYRKVGDATWLSLPLSNGGVIQEAKNSAVRRVYRLDNLAPAQYEVRCQCSAKSGETTRDMTRVYWTQISSIIYDDFCRPGKILVGIKALATSQLSGGDITVTWQQTLSNVWVWNPNTSQYVQMPATNHAWAGYDIIHGCRQLKNIHTGLYEFVVDNVPASRIDYQAVSDWATHCTALGITFNHLFDTSVDLWTALKAPETFGRGKIVPKGTKFSVVCDKPSTPIALFTVGNITQDKFSKDYAGLTDRANAIEISFINKDKGYQKDVITVFSDDYNTSTTVKNPTQITLDGCTSYAQAYQYGKYLLRVNKLMTRTVTWEADIDAITCTMGDQVFLQHDVPQWGFGGRIVDASSNSISIDRSVTLQPNTNYEIIIRLPDDSLITKTVIQAIPSTFLSPAFVEDNSWPANTVLETSILFISDTFANIPNKYDLYSFGEVGKSTKPFIVLEVDRINELTAKLTGIEYVAAVYEESLDAPIISYTTPDISVSDLSINKRAIWNGVSSESYLDVTWKSSRTNYYGAQVNIQFNGGTESKAATVGADTNLASIKISLPGTYTVVIHALDMLGNPVGTKLSGDIVISATVNAPEPAANTLSVSFTDVCLWAWGKSTDISVNSYELRTDINPGVDTNLLARTPATRTIATPPARSGTVYLYSHNISSFFSTPVSLAYNKAVPTAPAGLTITDVFQGFIVTVNAVPTGCTGANFYIGGVAYHSPNNSYAFSTPSGIYDVQVCYTDVFGEGTKTSVVTKTVIPTIDSSWVHVAANTVFDANVIVEGMISSGAITTPKLSAGAVTIDKMTVQLADIQGKLIAAQIDAGIISADKITTGTLSASRIDLSGYQVHASSLVKGTIANGATISPPNGYTADQCIWGVFINYDNPNSYSAGVGNDRIVRTFEWSGNNVVPSSCYYWIMGVK